MATTKIIIGLGNPDQEYQDTRHNIGFMFLDYLARLQRGSPSAAKKTDANDFEFDKKLNAELTKTKVEVAGKNYAAILVKPHSYVNATGVVAAKLKTHFKVKPEDFIIAQDDLDIPFGNVKLFFEKNSGGHRGIESVIKALKTNKFWRIRFGTANVAVKKAHQQSEKKKDELIRNFVLAKFTPKEREDLKSLFKSALERLAQKTN